MDTTKKTSKPGYEIAEADVQIYLKDELGEGGFGKVFKGTWLGDEVALKVLLTRIEGDMEAMFRREIEIMLKLQGCPRLVRLLGAVMEGPQQVMVMELMSGGNLHSLLRKEKDLDWDTKYRIALDVAYGIKYLHDRDFLHRDLKSMNVLLNEKGRAKIGDFGLAKVKSASKSHAMTKGSGVGTLLWMAPELFNLEVRFSNASDIYALGMVLYEMLSHKAPFETELQTRHPGIITHLIINGARPKLIETGPQDYKALIESCWHQVSVSRPVVSKVIEKLNLFKPKASKPELDQKLVNQFVQHVAYGEQDKAEAMLQRRPKLASGKGNCKDHAGREFKGITGFQYALWALDWHMWGMIRGYLDEVDPESAATQCQAQESLTSDQGHGAHFSFKPLISAYQTYIGQYNALSEVKNWKELDRLWIDGVGGAQQKVVAHVAQEYFHQARSFSPVTNFEARLFPRQLKVEKGDWWSVSYNGGGLEGTAGQVGRSESSGFAFLRAAGQEVMVNRGGGSLGAERGMRLWRVSNLSTLMKLCEMRTSQRNEICQELSTQPYHSSPGAKH